MSGVGEGDIEHPALPASQQQVCRQIQNAGAQEASQALSAPTAWDMVTHHWCPPGPAALAVEEAVVAAAGGPPQVLPEPVAETGSGAAAAEAAAAAGAVTAAWAAAAAAAGARVPSGWSEQHLAEARAYQLAGRVLDE